MLKYWGGNYFAHGSFPEVGQKQKTEETGGRDRMPGWDNIFHFVGT